MQNWQTGDTGGGGTQPRGGFVEQSEAPRDTQAASSPLDEITITGGSVDEALTGEEVDSDITLETALDLEISHPSRHEESSAADDLDWREEVGHRVETFRKRRSGLRERPDRSLTFDFDFEPAAATSRDSHRTPSRASDREAESAGGLAPSPKGEHRPSTDKSSVLPLSSADGAISPGDEIRLAPGPEKPRDGASRQSHAATLRKRAVSRIASARAASATDAEEEEGIRFERSGGSAQRTWSLTPEPWDDALPTEFRQESGLEEGLQVAPLGRRFLAGAIDSGVLALCLMIFGAIFLQAGGHFSRNLITLGTFAFVGLVFLVAYFGLFTAISGSTPGLHVFGLRVSSADGAIPPSSEAVMRAAGYVFSASALMLGFIWAAVDSDGLSWHDRMSDTFITASGFPCLEDDSPAASFEKSDV